MKNFGFVRVATCSPEIEVGNPMHNAGVLIDAMKRAHKEGVGILVFPELILTGYTCGDLFLQSSLQERVQAAIRQIHKWHKTCDMVSIFGAPLVSNKGKLYNCGIVIKDKTDIDVVPKIYLANYKNFYEKRWFSPGSERDNNEYVIFQLAPKHRLYGYLGKRRIFRSFNHPNICFGVEICEGLWNTIPPATYLTEKGATIICNLSASNAEIGKDTHRKMLVESFSARNHCVYVYANSLIESTTDMIFDGSSLIAEDGKTIAEQRKSSELLIADVDVDACVHARQVNFSFANEKEPDHDSNLLIDSEFSCKAMDSVPKDLQRKVNKYPFCAPLGDGADMMDWGHEITDMQLAALAHRLNHVKPPVITLGMSGGADSTWVFLLTRMLQDRNYLKYKPQFRYIAMPGFGTSRTTYNIVGELQAEFMGDSGGEQIEVIDIRPIAIEHFFSTGHKPFGRSLIPSKSKEVLPKTETMAQYLQDYLNSNPKVARDLVFENTQARIRTNILMNAGFMLGTSNMTELALGWTTYNGDHMSMYNVNAGVPKSAIMRLLHWYTNFSQPSNAVDAAYYRLPSHELVPGQDTIADVGNYLIHDFILYYFLGYGFSAEKIIYLGTAADIKEIDMKRHVKIFFDRFAANQFKRSCVTDGPKIFGISLSPRSDWRMPSDVVYPNT